MLTVSPDLLLVVGPGLLLVMAMAETSVPAGLLVPAGVALALGAFLASQGYLSLPWVVVAAGVGGLVGDSLGFWLGRKGFSRLLDSRGAAARMARRYEGLAARMYRRSPIVSVTLARTISFVRTLMPASAGMSGMTWPRFLVFDLLGVLAWLALYTAVGILAGESWKVASTLLGTGWAALLAGVALGAWILSRLRRPHPGEMELLEAALDGSGEEATPSSRSP